MASILRWRPHVPQTFKSWEVREDGQTEKDFNRWTNRDLIPTPAAERNYTGRSFFGFWIAAAVNISAWTLGSANLANGLTAGETIGMILVGAVLAGLISFISGEPGTKYHVGFPMVSRVGFGLYGSYFVITLKIFVNFIYFGIQAYWGGLAVKVLLSCLSESFQNMENTLPLSAAIETNQLIGFVIYIIVFTPMMLIHPSKLHSFLWVGFGFVTCTIVGLFIWAVSLNHGASVAPPSLAISSSTRSFRMLQAVSSVAGAWCGSAIRQSDWTRYARTKKASALNQLITLPLALTLAAALGAFATSATTHYYGKQIWQPIELLEFLLARNYDAKTRAGCFFAALGFFLSQISVNLVQNSVAAGMDLASLAPRWIDVRRGGLIMCVVGYAINPWRFVNAPGTFITVLSSFGMFISPLAGINAVDFWLIRKKMWRIPDLYIGNSSGIYWYTAGLNWRAFLAWTMGIWPSFPGFLIATKAIALTNPVWLRLFQTAWFIGFLGSGLIYFLVASIFPPPGKPYTSELFGNEDEGIINGHTPSGSDTPTDLEKEGYAPNLKGVHND